MLLRYAQTWLPLVSVTLTAAILFGRGVDYHRHAKL